MPYPKGYSVLTDPDKGVRERDIYSCCHCQRIVEVVPGSGKLRGWCIHCSRPHCGGPRCWVCIPWEAQIEAMEGRRKLWKQMEIRA